MDSPPPYNEVTDADDHPIWLTENLTENPPGYLGPQLPQSNYLPQADNYNHCYQPQRPAIPQVLVVNQQELMTPPQPEHRSFGLHIALSCFVFWLCGWMCGSVAFYLARQARKEEQCGQREKATNLGRSSIAISFVGMVFGSIAITVYMVFYFNSSSISQNFVYGSTPQTQYG